MKQLPAAFPALCLLFAILSCQPDTPKAVAPEQPGQVLAMLESLTKGIASTDTLKLKTIDSLLAEIKVWQVDSIDLGVAKICHESLGKPFLVPAPVLARKYYQQALDIRKRIYANDTTHIDILRLYHNLGLSHFNKEEYEKALPYFDMADVHTPAYLELFYFNNMLRRGTALRHIGEPARAIDDLQRAYQYFHDSLSLFDYAGKGKLIPEVLYEYAACYRLLNRYREGLEIAYEGNRIVRRMIPMPDPGSTMEHLAAIADLKMIAGNLWQDSMMVAKSASDRRMAFDSAVTLIEGAILLYDRTLEFNRKVTGISNLGALLCRAERYKESDAVLSAGIDFCKNSEAALDPALLYINRGYAQQKQKKFKEAFEDYRSAMAAFGGSQWNEATGFPALGTLQGNHSNIFDLLSNIASAWIEYAQVSQGDPQILAKAAVACNLLQEYAEFMRNNLMSDGAKLELAKDARKWVDQAVESNLQLYRLKMNEPEGGRYLEQAFKTAEQGKAFALLDAARLRNASRSLPASVQQEEQEIMEELSRAKNDPARKAAAERRKRKFFAKLEREQPQFFNLKYQRSNISTEDIRKRMLAKDQALLEYCCTDSALHCFLITPELVLADSVRISKTALSELVGEFQRLLELEKPSSEQNMAFIGYSHQLYQMLLSKLAPQLERYARLIIIPDAPLNNLSFEALIFKTSPGDVEKQVDDQNFLIFKHALSYCFSANLLWEMQRHKVPDTLDKKVAVFAAEADRKREVERLVASKHGEISPKNTADAFWDACSHFAFAHIAGHGTVNEANPGLSNIKFSDTSFLYLNDLYTHHIDLDMVALSSCETTKGRHSEGEGNLSLARGMAYAGARSFISTQWKIPIHGASEFVPRFYDTLFLENLPKDLALAKAKRAYLRDENDYRPVAWAGMVFIGACDMAVQEEKNCFLAWAALLLAGAVAAWFALRKKPAS